MKVSIRVVLILMMVVLAVVSCVIIGVLIGKAGVDSTNNGADLLRRETVKRKQVEVTNLFTTPISVLKSVAAASKVPGTFDHTNPTATYNNWLCSAILINDFRPVYLGTENGLLVYPSIASAGQPCEIKTINAANKVKAAVSYNFTDDNVPFLASPWTPIGSSGYDPRARPWYNQSRYQMAWSRVYVNGEEGGLETALTAATPLYSVADKRYVGVIGTDFVTSRVLAYLRTIVIAKTGKMILCETETRKVLGSTWGERVIDKVTMNDCGKHKNETCDKFVMTDLSAMEDPLLKNAVINLGEDYLFTCTRNSSTTEVLCRTTYGEGRDRVFVDVAGVTDEVGLNLRLIIMIPEEDFLGDVWRRSDLAAIIASVVVFCLIAVSVIVVYFVLKPLRRVEERLLCAATFNETNEDDEEESVFAEVANIQAAYNKMVAELKRIRSYVPQSLLRTLDRDDEDEDDDEGDVEHNSSTHRTANTGSVSRKSAQSDTQSNASRSTRKTVVALAAKKLDTSVALHTRRVTVVAVNLANFQEAAKKSSVPDLLATHSNALRAICQIATAQKGVFDFFSGDHFTVTFNAVTNCASHVTRAAAAILQISSRLEEANFGAASGQVLCGNMGTDEVKRFSIIGNAVNHAHILERMCRVVGVKNLVNYICHETMQFEYIMQCVDVVRLPQSKTTAPVSTILAPKNGATNDEWMYVLKEGEDNKASHTELNEAYAMYSTDNLNAAKELLAKISPEDTSVGTQNLRKMVNVPKDDWVSRFGMFYQVALLRDEVPKMV